MKTLTIDARKFPKVTAIFGRKKRHFIINQPVLEIQLGITPEGAVLVKLILEDPEVMNWNREAGEIKLLEYVKEA